ncbi:mutanobactin A non-ribosomal peptide synthetase MubC, partial [Streptococcus mutans]|nr:mutanobactin A non-ribosomal peptide synthetase MubC [Streptococcus mutans]
KKKKKNLIVEGIDFGNTVKFQITYPVELYDDDSIIQLMDSFLQVIESIIQNDRRYVKEIEIISQDQKDFIDLNYNKTAKDFKFDNQCLKQLIERNVAKMPNKIAIACDEENISFEQLNMRSNFMANKLKDLGLQVGDVVGVMKDRNIEAIIIILALIKLGVTYVPLDSGTPIERVKKIFVKSGMKFVITDLVPLQKDILIIDTNAPDFQGLSKQNPKTEINLDQMLYIIFTSGSTGEPKGVAISNKQCINTILDINHKFTLSPKDNILLISSFAFDLSVYDIFGALVSGATLTIASQNKDTNYLKKVVQNNPITVWNSVPAYMELICNVLADQKPILSIRNIILSGDWIPLELPLKIKKIFPNANLFSAGGATEGSIWSIYYPIVKVEPEWKSIPYGMPLANQQMYILNNMGNELPIGVMGNIYIGGVGVAMGYINDIEKTNDSFINHPKLGRIYKTGDLGRLTSQGYMEFCGRKDFQVKVNGNRIELGEIQAILQSFETIQNAIVTVGQNDYQKQLLAYYKSDNEIEKDVLNQFMKQYLPNYMIPSHYIYMSEFPLTSNGKIDKKQLPDPKKIESIKEVKDVKPKNQLEETVLTIWENVLEHQVLSVTDSFFSEGGNSLMATVI